jgi:hypothetical protein
MMMLSQQQVDPAMSANTNPFNLGWAYAFLVFPAVSFRFQYP